MKNLLAPRKDLTFFRETKENNTFFWYSSHLFVTLTCGRRYSRSRKLKKLLVFYSLIRTFAPLKMKNLWNFWNW